MYIENNLLIETIFQLEDLLVIGGDERTLIYVLSVNQKYRFNSIYRITDGILTIEFAQGV